MTCKLIVEEFDGKPCTWSMEAASIAELRAMLDLLTWNRDTDLRRQIKAEIRTSTDVVVFRLTWLAQTRTYWLQFCGK